MFRLTGTVRIEAPVERVFDYVSEWRNAPRFLHGLVRFQPVDPGHQYGLGSRFDATISVGPVRASGVMEVVEHDPCVRVSYRTISGPRMTGSWDFDTDGKVTVVRLTNDIEVPGGIAGRALLEFARSRAQHDLDASLLDLKWQLEEAHR